MTAIRLRAGGVLAGRRHLEQTRHETPRRKLEFRKYWVNPVEVVTSKIQVLDASDAGDSSLWDELVDGAPIPDVYYRPGYARANEAIDGGNAFALLISDQNMQVLVPLLLRPISELPFAAGQAGFDAVTPYGYGGLLPLAGRQPRKSDVPSLLDAIQDWCNASRVISCHIRLHPLLEQANWLDAIPSEDSTASMCFRSLTTAVDLTCWDSSDQRLAGISTMRRTNLHHARRHLQVLRSWSEISLAQALRLFRPIYEHRMTQLHASAYYYFPEHYYAALSDTTNSAVTLACLGSEVVGAYMFLADRQFAHYHLGGTTEKGLRLHASTLLLNIGAQWARERGCALMHFGGGGDSLFTFKTSFGGSIYRYHTLDVIAERSVYSDLVERRLCSNALPPPRQGFFPAYRA